MRYATGSTVDDFVLYGSIPESFANVSGFHTLTDAERIIYGFYQVVEHTPDCDPITQVVDGDVKVFADGVWTITYVVRDKNQAELGFERNNFITRIDQDANTIYDAVLGNRSMEYAQAETEATAYKAAGYVGDAPSYVASWAAAKKQSAEWAADNILATATAWRTAQDQIRLNRLVCKEQARTAVDFIELVAAVAHWNAFLSTIRTVLGVSQ